MSLMRDLRAELPQLVRLALPLVVAELGWMAMGVVDTMMVGRVSKEALGGAAMGGILFYTVGVFGMGLLMGLDTVVSQAFGAGRIAECHRYLVSGTWLAAALMLPMTGIVLACLPMLEWAGVQPGVMAEARPYTYAAAGSMGPLLLYTAFRRYLQSMNRVRVITAVLLSANLINVAVNWLLIFGNWGFPRLGVAGAGWATTVSRVYMAVALAVYIWRRAPAGLGEAGWKWEAGRVRELVRLGLPASAQMTLEVGIFGLSGLFVGKLPAEFLAAHQIALNVASVSFMVPYGLSSAAAVRVGQAVGRGDAAGARHAGWTAIGLGGGFMALAGLSFVLFPREIGRAYTSDPAVLGTVVSLLWVAALFQFFDGLQGVATGALRGLGDTRTPALTHLAAYWAIGMPASYWLCFRAGWNAVGVWSGLCLALVLIGITLVAVWRHRAGELRLSASYSERLDRGGSF
jgi:MATE family multidrug resistance protein